MPSIPIASPLSYIGVLFLIVGVFLIITGLDIVKVEKLTVTAGRRTLIVGMVLAAIGSFFLLPDFLKATNSANGTAATPEIQAVGVTPTRTEEPPTSTPAGLTTTPPAATETRPAPPSATPQPTEAAAATMTPTSVPTETPSTPASATPSNEGKSTPTPSISRKIIDHFAGTDATLQEAQSWPLLVRDEFVDDSTLANWTSVIRNAVPVSATIDGRFNVELPSDSGPVFAVFVHRNARYRDHMFATITVDPSRQAGCDYGIAFAADAASQTFYQFITQNDQKSFAVSYVDFTKFEIEPVARYGKVQKDAPLHSLSVIALDSTYRLFVDAEQVAEFKDQRLKGGQIGIIGVCESTEPSHFAVEDFEVRGE